MLEVEVEAETVSQLGLSVGLLRAVAEMAVMPLVPHLLLLVLDWLILVEVVAVAEVQIVLLALVMVRPGGLA
jgi:hypothetical protein